MTEAFKIIVKDAGGQCFANSHSTIADYIRILFLHVQYQEQSFSPLIISYKIIDIANITLTIQRGWRRDHGKRQVDLQSAEGEDIKLQLILTCTIRGMHHRFDPVLFGDSAENNIA
jgi:hypothetical protein